MKKGIARGVQTYQCKACGKKFSGPRRRKQTFIKKLWKEYVFHKQTIRELAKTYGMDRRMIRAYLTKYVPPRKVHIPRAVHLVVDGTYFGIRGDDTEWCMVVFRDPTQKRISGGGSVILRQRASIATGGSTLNPSVIPSPRSPVTDLAASDRRFSAPRSRCVMSIWSGW